jgi:hypothetical protein
MPAPPIVKHIYREILERFGEPDGAFLFDDPPPPPGSGWPERIDVFFWRETADLDITTFATLGMADKPMAQCGHRCELCFSIRRPADTMDLRLVSNFCANLALYPFRKGTFFDWTQVLANPGEIPYFPRCTSLWFHPKFGEEGWDTMEFEGIPIKIINLVPITPDEAAYRAANGPASLYEYFAKNRIDVFKDR